jgi:2-polyprenyl-3-methyl-5-hydroxy-6-metoxy-1,4-benzoquinol methylase
MRARACPICHGETRPFLNGRLLECIECTAVFDPAPPLDKTYYEQERVLHIDEKKIEPRKRNVRQRATLLKKFLSKEQSLLDIGCGEGLFLQEISGIVGSANGLEPTHLYAEYAKNNLHLDVKQGTVEETIFPDEFFDVITMFHVLEHLTDPEDTLRNLRKWLKHRGLLVIEVPNIQSPAARYKGMSWELIFPEHRLYFTQRSLRYLLEKSGFENISILTRDFDQYRTGIGKSLRKLCYFGEKSRRQRTSQAPGTKAVQESGTREVSSLRRFRKKVQLPMMALLGQLAMKFGRSDYLFAIARKS